MARYIDADRMIDGFKINMERMDLNNLTKEIANIFIEGLQMEPTADVVEVKHGEWIRHSPDVAAMRAFHKLGIGKGMGEIASFGLVLVAIVGELLHRIIALTAVQKWMEVR